MLNVLVRGRLRRQGLTELFFESAEPTFDELAPEDFFRRFPEGEYEIEGISIEGDELEGEVELSHVLAAPAENVRLNGILAAEDCDADLPVVEAPVVISWNEVVDSHPELEREADIQVAKYQLVVEREEPELLVLSVDRPPGSTSFEVPEDFTDLGDEMKFEILVQLENGDRTAIESCFELD
jgi:hypothetical protein